MRSGVAKRGVGGEGRVKGRDKGRGEGGLVKGRVKEGLVKGHDLIEHKNE